MKALLFIHFLYFSCHLYAQEKVNCGIINSLLQDKRAQRELYLDDYKNLPIVFTDIKNNFKECNIQSFNGRKIEIVHDSSYLSKKGVQYITINDLKSAHPKYTIYIYQKATGAAGRIEFIRTKNKMVVSKYKIGYY